MVRLRLRCRNFQDSSHSNPRRADTESTETFNVILSNAIGATIVDGVGIGSILNNDPFTKLYVVNDASTDRTFEYGTSGASVENYALGGGNNAHRGQLHEPTYRLVAGYTNFCEQVPIDFPPAANSLCRGAEHRSSTGR